jgi:hypothetical protein
VNARKQPHCQLRADFHTAVAMLCDWRGGCIVSHQRSESTDGARITDLQAPA